MIASYIIFYPVEDVHVSPADGYIAWNLAFVLLHHFHSIKVINNLCVLLHIIPFELNDPLLYYLLDS